MAAGRTRIEGGPIVREGGCRYLRCKGMYTGPRDEVDPHMMAYDATIWWCGITEKQLGPDDRPCHASRCRAGRPCFEE